MTALYVVAAFSVVFSIITAYLTVKQKNAIRIVTKSIASFLFCLVGLLALRYSLHIRYAMAINIALLLGLLGDILLCLGGLCSSKSDNDVFDLSGVVAFAAGHIFFIVIFLMLAPMNYALLPIVLALPLLFVFMIKFKLVSGGKQAPFIMVYAAILGMMVVSALNVYLAERTTAALLLLIASLLFTISDCTLALKNYGTEKVRDKVCLPYIVMVFYYVAQCIFAITVALR